MISDAGHAQPGTSPLEHRARARSGAAAFEPLNGDDPYQSFDPGSTNLC